MCVTHTLYSSLKSTIEGTRFAVQAYMYYVYEPHHIINDITNTTAIARKLRLTVVEHFEFTIRNACAHFKV